jgi:hypothetical protein
MTIPDFVFPMWFWLYLVLWFLPGLIGAIWLARKGYMRFSPDARAADPLSGAGFIGGAGILWILGPLIAGPIMLLVAALRRPKQP